MARIKIAEGPIFAWTDTATQLTAPGVTTSVDVIGSRNHTISATIASIDTTVVLQVEGTIDGTNYFKLPLESVLVSGLTITSNVATITANGTYLLYVKDVAIQKIRANFTSETGGTAATVDISLNSQN